MGRMGFLSKGGRSYRLGRRWSLPWRSEEEPEGSLTGGQTKQRAGAEARRDGRGIASAHGQ